MMALEWIIAIFIIGYIFINLLLFWIKIKIKGCKEEDEKDII